MPRLQWVLFVLLLSIMAAWSLPASPAVLAALVSSNRLTVLAPPIIDVELSGYEPPLPGVASVIAFGGKGGGTGTTYYTTPQWMGRLGKSYIPSTRIGFSACGYKPNTLPKTTITFPDGSVNSWSGRAYSTRSNCWGVSFPSWYGMQLGNYTIILESPAGALRHTFSVELDNHMALSTTILNNNEELRLVFGVTPLRSTHLQFYNYYSNEHGVDGAFFIAERTSMSDALGTLAVRLTVSRSAPFKRDDVELFLPGGFADSAGEPMNCKNSPRPRLRPGQNARVTPGTANVLRDEPGWVESQSEGSKKIGRIPGGTTVLVTGGPVCGLNGRAYWRVVYNGKIGWTAEGEGNEYWMEPAQ